MNSSPLDLIRARESAFAHLAGSHGLKRLGDTGRCALMTKDARADTAAIDTHRLIVPGTITTQDEDRSRDVVRTDGVDLSDHQTNPQVLYEHGFSNDPDIGTKAIAKAEDQAGAYRVVREEGRIRAYSHFNPKFKAAMQLFELYADGFLRGLSIGIIPVQLEYRRDTAPGADGMMGAPGLLILQSKLFEYSFCSIPDNPHALADRILGKGLLDGRPIAPGLFKSLSSHLPHRPEQVVSGFAQTATENDMATPAPETPATTPAPAPPVPKTKSKPAAPAANGNGHAKPQLFRKSENGDYVPLSEDGSTTTTMEQDQEEDQGLSGLPEQPVGALVSQGIHDRLVDLGEYLELAATRQENERLSAILEALAEQVTNACDEMTGFYAGEYPDLPKLEGEPPADDEPETKSDGGEGDDEPDLEEDEELPPGKGRKRLGPRAAVLAGRLDALRKYRAARPVHKRLTKSAQRVCRKAAGYLDEVSDHEGELKESHKSAAKYHSRTLSELAQAGDGEGMEDEEMKALRDENEKYRRTMAKLTKQHERLISEFRKLRFGR